MNIVWFRNNLRISDNPPLYDACKKGEVLAVYILEEGIGAASKYWLNHSLTSLNKSLGGMLNFYKGDPKDILHKLQSEHNAEDIYYSKNFHNDPHFGVGFNADLLWNPEEIKNGSGDYYKVFTPFYRKGCLNARPPRTPLPKPDKMDLVKDPAALSLEDLDLMPKINWHSEMGKIWDIGEEAAKKRLANFIEDGLVGYKEGRNFPTKNNVSRLSPYLHFGEVSVNEVYYAVRGEGADVDHFRSELGWREFSYYLLHYFPGLTSDNFQPKFDKFPWDNNESHLKAWQKGQTGIPIVDAGMRELWQTGYMHNRVRMIVGSFLVKNLLIDWRKGRDWFDDCLVDADIANNNASWQWVAGSGADAAPYFRIFNCVLQGEKFDQDGEYTKKYVPELKNLDAKYLFKPWEAPPLILMEAGITLGKTYPNPIVDLSVTRNRALEAYEEIK